MGASSTASPARHFKSQPAAATVRAEAKDLASVKEVSASEGPVAARWAEALVPAEWAEDRREGKERREVETGRTSCWFGIAVASGSTGF
jgi:hypothetical protein